MPLNAWWTGAELAFGIENSGSKVLVCDHERLDRLSSDLDKVTTLETMIVSRAPEASDDYIQLESVIGAPSTWNTLPDQDLPDVEVKPEDRATISGRFFS